MKGTKLRNRILEAIQVMNVPCWLTIKGGHAGLAGFLDFFTSKVYLEVMFLPKGKEEVPLKINVFNTQKLVDETEFLQKCTRIKESVENYIDPLPVLRYLEDKRLSFIETARKVLEEEINAFDSRYENAPVDGDRYHRVVHIHVPSAIKTFEISFQSYPNVPDVFIPDEMMAGLRLKATSSLKSIKSWKSNGKSHVIDIIDEIASLLFNKDVDNARCFQAIIATKFKVPGGSVMHFQFPRANTLGIFSEAGNSSEILELLYATITGAKKDKDQALCIFGKNIGDTTSTPPAVAWIDNSLPETPFLTTAGQFIKECIITRRGFSSPRNIFKTILQDTGLDLIRRQRVRTLAPQEAIFLNMASALAAGKEILFIDLEKLGITRLEYDQYRKLLTSVALDFHVIVVAAAPPGIMASFSKILTISAEKRSTRAGTIDEIKAGMAGDVILLQVKGVDAGFPKRLESIAGKDVIEEIPLERYRILVLEGSKMMMVDLCSKFGENIYKISRATPDLDDYLKFVSSGIIKAI